MHDVNDDEIKNLISLDTFNDTSLFAVSVIDLSTYEVIYTNQAMKNIMSDMTAQNCWESIHGQEAPCMWCKAPILLSKLSLNKTKNESVIDKEYSIYEHFNETANRWYQLQEKVLTLKDSRNVLVSFALDISIQKEAQSDLINTHVKLSKQTQALQEAQSKLKELANKDPLTNIYNRRYFNEMANKNIVSFKHNKQPSSLLMIDIDNFKNINDTYGHSTGDNVIKFLADELVSQTSEEDIVARFGGEEFAILLVNKDRNDAYLLADKIRASVENNRLEQCSLKKSDDLIQFTISIGLDSLDYEKDMQIDLPLNRADKALYQAKTSGKNMVCLYK